MADVATLVHGLPSCTGGHKKQEECTNSLVPGGAGTVQDAVLEVA